MKYQQPHGVSDADAAYIDGNPALGVEGSAVPAKAIEHPQREIVNVIKEAGLTPDEANLRQLTLAIQRLIETAIPSRQDKYDLCEFYYFRHPTLRQGFQPAQGGVIANAATAYPAAWAYLQTAEGQLLCRTEAEWQAMTTAIWHTNADGSTVGWDGRGGAPYYVRDLAAGTLRLPDLRGMYAEAAGFDSLDVGGLHGDAIRNFAGTIGQYISGASALWSRAGITGVITLDQGVGSQEATDASNNDSGYRLKINASRVVPTSNANKPRAWGALACVYLGQPAS